MKNYNFKIGDKVYIKSDVKHKIYTIKDILLSEYPYLLDDPGEYLFQNKDIQYALPYRKIIKRILDE